MTSEEEKENYILHTSYVKLQTQKNYLQIQTSAEWITEVISQAAKESQQDGI